MNDATTNASALPAHPLYQMRDVEAVTTLHRKTIMRLVKDGKFPPARQCGRKFFWPRAVVLAFLGLDTQNPAGARA